MILSVLLLASMIVPIHTASALPSPFLITTLAVTDDPIDGKCDLYEALQAGYQANSGGNATYHECAAASGPIVIGFAPSLVGGTVKLDGKALPFIHDNTTIIGTGVTIDGGGVGKDIHVFHLAPGASLNLVGLAITNAWTNGSGPAILDDNQGSINLVGVSLMSNTAVTGGGAISSNGSLTIMASNLTGNTASGDTSDIGYGGAVAFSGGGTLSISKSNFAGNIAKGTGGGAIYIRATSNTGNSIADTLISGNIANNGGGAIYNASSSLDSMLKIERVAFTGNLSPSGSGAAIWNGINGFVGLSDASFNLNVAGTPVSAQMGGAIYSQSSKFSITRSAFMANASAGGDGGALAIDRHGTADVSNTTFSGNLAVLGKGGAIWVGNTQAGGSESTLNSTNDTIAWNSADVTSSAKGGGVFADAGHTAHFHNTILANNNSENCAGTGNFSSLGHSLDSGNTCNFSAANGDLINTDPYLDKPGFNGGPMTSLLSMKLQSDSPAIDKGDAAVCTAAPVANKDQRGEARPKDGGNGGGCDMGSFEADAAIPGFGSTPGQPGPIAIGNPTMGGAPVTNTFKVANVGKGSLHISAAAITPSGLTNPGEITVTGGVPSYIPAGGNQLITLSCQGATAGTRTAKLTLTTNDPNLTSVDYNLTCGVQSLPKAGFASTPITPGPITFPATVVGQTSQATITVNEVGNLNLTVTNPVKSGMHSADFAVVSGLPMSITNGTAAKTITLSCTPSAIGMRSAKLALTTNDPDQTSVSYDLVCKGIPAPSPAMTLSSSLTPPLFTDFSSPTGLAFSPDARFAYVVNSTTGTIVQLYRATGLTAYLPFNKNSVLTNPNLAGARMVAMSPDGKNVFVAAETANALVVYSRDHDTGVLSNPVTFKNGVGGVINLVAPYGVVVSPDGNYVYVSASTGENPNGGSIAIFKRKPDGSFGFKTFLYSTSFYGMRGLAISPDGITLYAAGHTLANNTNGSLYVFSRNLTDGTITQAQTRSQGDCIDYTFCTPNGVGSLDGMKGATRVAVSPDGNDVYVTGYYSNAILQFKRDPMTGKLTIYNSTVNGQLGVSGLVGVMGIAFSPDGTLVYTGSYLDKSAVVFERDIDTGILTFKQKFQRSPWTGTPASPMLNGAWDIASSPDSQLVLCTAATDNSVVQLAYASPVPTLESLQPASKTAGGADFTLVIRGKDFVQGAGVRFNGYDRSSVTTFINDTELHVTISAADIATAGNMNVVVTNPSPGGGNSNTLTFRNENLSNVVQGSEWSVSRLK
jgi:predicted outer membrane repeat protein